MSKVTQPKFLPLRFGPQEIYLEKAKLFDKVLAEHEGYSRENDGSWIIVDAEGVGRVVVRFMGTAKRGQGWTTPDPEGMALAKYITNAANCYADLLSFAESIEGEVDLCPRWLRIEAAAVVKKARGENV